MVMRLVRAGVGALLLLIAVPLVFVGGGLWVAMGHRAADETFTAELERLRSEGRAVVVPDIDALLRADAPFARGGQTTLNLSAVGSSGSLFIGLAPDTAVQQYLDGLVQARVSRVRLAQGPLPVELTEIETRAASASPGRPAGSTAGGNDPAVPGPAGNPGAAADPDTGAAAVPADPNAAKEPNAGDPDATTNAGDPAATPRDPAAAGDPNATTSGGNVTTSGGNVTANSGNEDGTASAVPLTAPAGQKFWLAKSITVGGAAELAWSPSALRGKHLALVVMNADGTAGINVTVTARLSPAWIGPTAGGLLMLGTAMFLLALFVLAWPPRRVEERLVLPTLPTLPSQPTKGRSLRRNLSTLADPIAALLTPVVPKKHAAVASQTEVEDDLQVTMIGVVVTEEGTSPGITGEDEHNEQHESAGQDATAEDDEPAADVAIEVVGTDVPAPQEENGQAEAAGATTVVLAESELDRPAPAAAIDDDESGPLVLPPLPKLPPIELQFTWAPLTVDEQEADQEAALEAQPAARHEAGPENRHEAGQGEREEAAASR